MSETLSAPEGNQHQHQHHVGAVQDIYLTVLLQMLDSDESNRSEISVTLMVGGSVITGNLISHGRWEEATRAVLTGVAGDGASALVTMIDALREALPRSEEDDSVPFNFLHLRDVHIVTNHAGSMNGIVPFAIKRDLWRVQIAEVQGWTLGR
jgi:hypothetical protein